MISNNKPDSISLGTRTSLVFVDKNVSVLATNKLPFRTYHYITINDIDLDHDVFIIGSKSQQSEITTIYKALLAKSERNVYARLYDDGLGSFKDVKQFMEWLEQAEGTELVELLEKWLLLDCVENVESKKTKAKPKANSKAKHPAGDSTKQETTANDTPPNPPKADPTKVESEWKDRISPLNEANLYLDQVGNNLTFFADRENFYHWSGTHWKPSKQLDVTKKVQNFLLTEKIDYQSPSYLKQVVEEVAIRLRTDYTHTEALFDYIPFTNGYLDLNTLELITDIEAIKKIGLTCCLPFRYQKFLSLGDSFIKDNHINHGLNSPAKPILEWMLEAQDGDYQRVTKLLAICNAVITRKFAKYQKFIYCLGKPRTGKTTFMRLLEAMVGRENCLYLKLSQITDRFALAEAMDKLLIMFGDEGKTRIGKQTEMFKDLSGGGSFQSERKFKDGVLATISGTFGIVGNQPVFSGGDAAIDARKCLIEFNRIVPEADRDIYLIEKLTETSAMESFIGLVLSLPDTMVKSYLRGTGEGRIASLEISLMENDATEDSVKGFWNERIRVNPAGRLYIGNAKTTDVIRYAYASYQDRCDEQGIPPSHRVGLKTFRTRLLGIADNLNVDYQVDLRDEIGHRYVSGLELLSKPNSYCELDTLTDELRKKLIEKQSVNPSIRQNETQEPCQTVVTVLDGLKNNPSSIRQVDGSIRQEAQSVKSESVEIDDQSTNAIESSNELDGLTGSDGFLTGFDGLKNNPTSTQSLTSKGIEKTLDGLTDSNEKLLNFLPTEVNFLFEVGEIVKLRTGCPDENCWVIKKRELEDGTKPSYYLKHANGRYSPTEKYEDALEKIVSQLPLF